MATADFAGAHWITSSHSQGNGECVELGMADGLVGIRDSKLGMASPVLRLTPDAFEGLLGDVTRPVE